MLLHLLVPDNAKAGKDRILVKQCIQRSAKMPLVSQGHEELIDDEIVVGERSVIRVRSAYLRDDVLPETVPVCVRTKCLCDDEPVMPNWREQMLDLLRPVGPDTVFRPIGHRVVELVPGERLLGVEVLEEEVEGLSLSVGVWHSRLQVMANKEACEYLFS